MRSAIKQAMTVLVATAGLVGCGNMDDQDIVGANGAGSAAGTVADQIETISSALTFSQCSTKIINRGNEAAVKALVGDLVSMHDLGNGARGEYSKGGSIFCNGANGDTKYVVGLIRQKHFAKGAQAFGYPTTDELPNAFSTGRYNIFNGGNAVILWKNGAAEAFEIKNGIRQLFAFLGSENGEMGFVTADEATVGTRKRNILEFGRIYSNASGAWPVMTSGGNSSDKLATLNLPRITSVSMPADGFGGGCLRASGAGFTPGQTVELRITNPNSVSDHAGQVAVASNGTFSFVDSPGGSGSCTERNFIQKTNGFATAWAVEVNTGKSAVSAFSTQAGIAFGGTP